MVWIWMLGSDGGEHGALHVRHQTAMVIGTRWILSGPGGGSCL